MRRRVTVVGYACITVKVFTKVELWCLCISSNKNTPFDNTLSLRGNHVPHIFGIPIKTRYATEVTTHTGQNNHLFFCSASCCYIPLEWLDILLLYSIRMIRHLFVTFCTIKYTSVQIYISHCTYTAFCLKIRDWPQVHYMTVNCLGI